MMRRKKVGIFGGSFDPIHFGHLNMAISLMEVCALDEVVFVPAGLSPFKENAPPQVQGKHRLRMIELAIESAAGLTLLDWELNSDGPSYTIDTVERLAQDSSLDLHLLMGEDHLAHFHRWKEAEELIRLAPPLVAGRLAKEKLEEGPFGHSLARVPIPLFDISSTDVRLRLSQKKYCGHLVPSSVLDYIEKHRLYS